MWMLNARPITVFTYGSKKVTKNSKFKKESLLVYIFEFPQNIIVKITANAAGIYNHFHKLKIFEKNKTIEHNSSTSQILLSSAEGIIKKSYPSYQIKK